MGRVRNEKRKVKSEKRRACSAPHERDDLQALIIVGHELKLLNTWKQVCDSRQHRDFTFSLLAFTFTKVVYLYHADNGVRNDDRP